MVPSGDETTTFPVVEEIVGLMPDKPEEFVIPKVPMFTAAVIAPFEPSLA
jgi:hypothetical protein